MTVSMGVLVLVVLVLGLLRMLVFISAVLLLRPLRLCFLTLPPDIARAARFKCRINRLLHGHATRGRGSPTVLVVVVILLPIRVTLPLVRIAPVSRRRAVRRERRSLGAQDGRCSGGKRSDKWSVEAGAEVGRGI